jgi:hypothetical protein
MPRVRRVLRLDLWKSEGRNNQPASESFRRLRVTSRIIRNLISKGLIQRENSEVDARVFFLSTTTRGKEVRLTARRVSDNLDTVLTDPLSAEDLRQLDDILARLGRWVTSGDFQAALTERV